jgi:hypothetical protein
MATLGAFDPELRREALFDPTLVAEGWFDPELIDAAGSSRPDDGPGRGRFTGSS